MNELKPEDVTRALDILDKMDFFQGQRAGRELWFEKPFEVQEQDIADFSQGIEFVKNIIADADALALIREMKKQIRKLEDDVENFKSIAEYQQNCNVNRYHIIKEKDAEIERLEEQCNNYENAIDEGKENCSRCRSSYHALIDKAYNKAITEFTERLKTFYKHLPGNTVGGSVEYHIDQVAKEMKGEDRDD